MEKKFPNSNKLLLCIKNLVSEEESKHIEHLGLSKNQLEETLETLQSGESQIYDIGWLRNLSDRLMQLHPIAHYVPEYPPDQRSIDCICIDCPDFIGLLNQAEKEIDLELKRSIKNNIQVD